MVSGFEYAVRHSARATRPRLRVDPRSGLTVVVPRGWRGDADPLVRANAAWVERALARYADRIEAHRRGPCALLPATITLAACGLRLVVEHRVTTGAGPVRIERSEGSLVVEGPDDPGARLTALVRWLHRTARAVLIPWARELAERHGLAPSQVRVSGARTRWGSCSSMGTISLSRALLFLPPHLVEALILHELAHLRVPGHSERFWEELLALDPRAREHHRELHGAWRAVPPWAEARPDSLRSVS